MKSKEISKLPSSGVIGKHVIYIDFGDSYVEYYFK